MNPQEIEERRAGVYRVVGPDRVWILGEKRAPGTELELTTDYARNLGPAVERVVVSDAALAYALIDRLNALVEDPAVRSDVEQLLAQRVPCSEATADHPTIQVDGETMTLGLLGLLNGLCGTIQGGPRDGWGRIASSYEENGGPLLGLLHSNETQPA